MEVESECHRPGQQREKAARNEAACRDQDELPPAGGSRNARPLVAMILL
jgi:hypothetical protein